MRALDYALRHAWAGLWRGGTGTVLAVLSIAVATSVFGAVLLVAFNAGRLLDRWRSSAEFSVYLRDDATAEQRGVVEQVLQQSEAVAGVEFVSKAQALGRFREAFSELAALTEEFPDNPFPASVEARLVDSPAGRDAGDALLRRVATLPGVSDVRYDRAWLERVASAVATVQRIGLALAMVLAVAAAVTVASVVRLGMHARRDEIEIMELVGATSAYMRGPFIAEGLLQGGLGACVALLAVFVAYRAGTAAWGAPVAEAFDGLTPRFLSAALCLAVVVGGMVVGAAGGALASRRP